MDRPISIGNVHNVSLESFGDKLSHLVAQFLCESCDDCVVDIDDVCVCCAAVLFHDMKNATFKGISLSILTLDVSGVVVRNASYIDVQVSIRYYLTNRVCLGIAFYEATFVEVYSSSVTNCSYGLTIYATSNIHITNMTAMYNEIGISMDTAHDTFVTNAITMHNDVDGIRLAFLKNTYITNTVVSQNHQAGIVFYGMNNTHITNLLVTHNQENGVFLDTMNYTYVSSTTSMHNLENGMVFYNTKHTYITNTTAHYNGVGYQAEITFYLSTYILLFNNNITDISAPPFPNAADPTKLRAVFALYKSNLRIKKCYFMRNNISAIKAFASNVSVSGNLTISGNRAYDGTAFILVSNSIVTLEEGSHIYFINNHATNTGGVFYISTNMYIAEEFHLRSVCFITTEKETSEFRMTFLNNSASKGGDIVYGGHVVFGTNKYGNCLDTFMRISNISQHGLSLISSDPSRVCLCNGTRQPDCLTIVGPKIPSICPGQTIKLSAVLVGQDFGTVAGSVFAQFLSQFSTHISPELESWQKVQAVTQLKCNDLQYSIFSQNTLSDVVLVLTAHDIHVTNILSKNETEQQYSLAYRTSNVDLLTYSSTPVFISISIFPCPPGFMLTNESPFRCDCSQLLKKMHRFHCHIQDQTIGRSGQLWVGRVEGGNETEEAVVASKYCSLDYCKGEFINVSLSDPDSQCSYKHSGILCGGCQPGLSLALGSAQCLQCSNKYIALLIPFTLAGPVLVLIIKLLDLTISQGTLNGLIFYANIVKASDYIFLVPGRTYSLNIFIAWLNLDLGVETCFFQGLSAYSKTWLQFVFPFYILSIAWLIIILAKYCDALAKVMGENSVPVLATLFLLSYAKLFRTIITALSYTMLYSSQGEKAVWTADGNLDYLGPKHATLFAMAVAVLLLIWLPYTLLLFLGQWLHICNCRLISYMLIKLKPFLDAHYGPLKGEHRYWFGALLLVRAAILLISALVPTDHANIVVICILTSAAVLMYIGRVVYQNVIVSMFDTSFFLNLVLLAGSNLFISTGEGKTIAAAYTLIGMAFIQFVGLVLFKMFTIIKESEKVKACLHKRQQPAEDDWELYEEAALLREVESDEEQDSEDTGSIESLPAY